MVAAIRRLSGERRVGHAGTLDPDATGVLPICLGQGTRLVEFLLMGKKEYRAAIEFGVITDTYDAAGNILDRRDISSLTLGMIDNAVASFLGTVEQLPPRYSAIKHKGQPLYRWARAGIEVPIKTRKVEFSRLEVLEWQSPVLTIEVECSSGTYIRSLAYDLGMNLGCGAHLKNLIRLRSGPFRIEDSVSISQVEDAFARGNWGDVIQPIDAAILHLPAVTVDDENAGKITNGRIVMLEGEEDVIGSWQRAYSRDGRLIALLRYDEDQAMWHPKKVFVPSVVS